MNKMEKEKVTIYLKDNEVVFLGSKRIITLSFSYYRIYYLVLIFSVHNNNFYDHMDYVVINVKKENYRGILFIERD